MSTLPRSGSIASVGLEREELRPAAHGRRPDPHARREPIRAAERVARILALEVGADREAVVVGRSHVLRRVDGNVDATLEQRLLELLDEDAALADLPERPRAITVARRRDRDERDLDARPRRPERLGRELCLQSAPAGCRASRASAASSYRDGRLI